MSTSGLRFASLGSGSRGNAMLIEAGTTCVLLDCGFSARETAQRLARAGKDGCEIAAIILTHEHNDHIGGVGPVARQWGLPVWMTAGTRHAVERKVGRLPEVRVFNPHETFEIGDLRVEPFPVPHDAREPSQFVFSDGGRRLGVLTDVGSSTPHIEKVLSGCDALLLECNHDIDMLWDGPYSPALKARVGSDQGHLDNDTAAALLGRLDNSRLQHIVAAHLSEQNNTEFLARQALSGALGCSDGWVRVASQRTGIDWCEIT